jgi:hypothetical protein
MYVVKSTLYMYVGKVHYTCMLLKVHYTCMLEIFIKIYNFIFFFKCEEFLENIEKCKKRSFSQKLEILINLN